MIDTHHRFVVTNQLNFFKTALNLLWHSDEAICPSKLSNSSPFSAPLTSTAQQFTAPLTFRMYIILSTHKQTHYWLYFNRYCKHQDPIYHQVYPKWQFWFWNVFAMLILTFNKIFGLCFVLLTAFSRKCNEPPELSFFFPPSISTSKDLMPIQLFQREKNAGYERRVLLSQSLAQGEFIGNASYLWHSLAERIPYDNKKALLSKGKDYAKGN